MMTQGNTSPGESRDKGTEGQRHGGTKARRHEVAPAALGAPFVLPCLRASVPFVVVNSSLLLRRFFAEGLEIVFDQLEILGADFFVLSLDDGLAVAGMKFGPFFTL